MLVVIFWIDITLSQLTINRYQSQYFFWYHRRPYIFAKVWRFSTQAVLNLVRKQHAEPFDWVRMCVAQHGLGSSAVPGMSPTRYRKVPLGRVIENTSFIILFQ
jgi:hypothetical protein